MKKIVTAEILAHEAIASRVHRLVLFAPEVAQSACAGQFVNVYLRDSAMLLPRPLSICERRGERIVLVYGIVGRGTKQLSEYRVGTHLRISTPGGNGFDLTAMKEYKGKIWGKNDEMSRNRILLAGGGIGVPPMVELAKELRQLYGESLFLIGAVGFSEEAFLISELETYCHAVHVATDTGKRGYHGNVVQMLNSKKITFDYGFACGPKAMLKALCEYGKGIPVQVSMEERMGCGYGACVGCVCKIRTQSKEEVGSEREGRVQLKKVCKDGPVFLGSEVIFDEEA